MNVEIAKEYLKLIRCWIITIEPIVLLAGAILATGLQLSWNYLYLLIAYAIIHAQIYGWNDYWDVNYDKTKNRIKDKPLLSGKLGISEVRHFLLLMLIPLFIIFFLLDYGYLLLFPLVAGLIYDKFSKRAVYATFSFGLYGSLLPITGAIIVGGTLTKIVLLDSLYLGLEASFAISITGALKDKDDLYVALGFRKLACAGLIIRLVSLLLLISLLILIGFSPILILLIIVCTALLFFISYAMMLKGEHNGNYRRAQFLCTPRVG